MFSDELELEIKAGHGGEGSVSFRREKFVPFGGPDGGDGGKGGDVIFQVKKELRTLNHLKSKKCLKAENGQHGGARNMEGHAGEDLLIYVPEGTIIKDLETDEIIFDLSGDDLSFVLAHGGIGGKGNAFFKTSTNQTPKHAQSGKEGEEFQVKLELKMIADIGLVGFPNAGKSTFLSCISRAHPKIAPYPFTTLHPNLGVVNLEQYQQYIVADIPGIIEGASKGIGLGIRFLKHIERTKGILYLIDISEVNMYEQFCILKNELNEYSSNMLKKPFYIALNKIDLMEKEMSEEILSEFKKQLNDETIPIYLISAATNDGVGTLKKKLYELIK